MIQLKPGLTPAALNKPQKTAGRATRSGIRKTKRTGGGGLCVERVFSDPKVRPFDQVEWERRIAEITDDSGTVIFKQENVEVPKDWSALATQIAVSSHFYGDLAHGIAPDKSRRDSSVREIMH